MRTLIFLFCLLLGAIDGFAQQKDESKKAGTEPATNTQPQNQTARPAIEELVPIKTEPRQPTQMTEAQPEKEAAKPQEKVYEMFDIQRPPTFPGGEMALLKYLKDNIVYPPLAKEHNIQGKVVLTFVVNRDGTLSDIQIVRDLGGGTGREAARVMQASPRWSPGEKNGHAIAVRYTLPVMFRLPDKE